MPYITHITSPNNGVHQQERIQNSETRINFFHLLLVYLLFEEAVCAVYHTYHLSEQGVNQQERVQNFEIRINFFHLLLVYLLFGETVCTV